MLELNVYVLMNTGVKCSCSIELKWLFKKIRALLADKCGNLLTSHYLVKMLIKSKSNLTEIKGIVS